MRSFAALLILTISAAAHAQTTLQVVNARASELYPLQGPNVRPEDACIFQGCAEPDYATRITALRIDRIYPWKTPPTRRGFAKTEVVATCPLESDGSVKCQIPAGIVYQLRGIDAAGAVVATDGTLHTAVQGERVTCHGCHIHSEEVAAKMPPAAELFKSTIAGKKASP